MDTEKIVGINKIKKSIQKFWANIGTSDRPSIYEEYSTPMNIEAKYLSVLGYGITYDEISK